MADKIALIAPNKRFTSQVLDLFGEWGEKIHVAMASADNVIIIAQQLSEKGAEAIICHASFFEAVRTTVTIPTVALQPSILDILRSMQKARKWILENRRNQLDPSLVIGIVGRLISEDAVMLAHMLELQPEPLPQMEAAVAGPEVLAVIREIPEVASAENGQIALNDGVASIAVAIGRETLMSAIRRAQQLIAEGRRRAAQMEHIKAIMEFTGQAIVAIDSLGRIDYVNHIAEQLLKHKQEALVGCPAAEVFPGIHIEDALHYGQPRSAPFIDGQETALVYRIMPMMIGRQNVGAVLTIAEPVLPLREKGKEYAGKGHKPLYHFDDFITVNETMKERLEVAKQYAGVDSTILIIGETGTGKEIIAQSIHNHSWRCQGPFVAVNCAAVPESLLESELFGYEYGAFTGARKNGKKGLFEQANQGTIFLDEIGDVSLSMQAELLRVIQEREVMRLGGDKVISVNVRIVAATHRNLPELIEKGLFRRDLYHRLNILQLHLLPLSARIEDIPYLTENINERLSAKLLKTPLRFGAGALHVLMGHPWSGNVRELESVIERILILKSGGMVTEEDVRKALDYDAGRKSNAIRIIPKGTMAEMERAIIQQVLNETQNQDEAAQILGISTTTIWRKMKNISE